MVHQKILIEMRANSKENLGLLGHTYGLWNEETYSLDDGTERHMTF